MSEFTLHPQLEADSYFVKNLPLSQLRLINDRQFPWVVLVPRVPEITEAHQMNPDDRLQLVKESDNVCIALEMLFSPDKLNVAAIGNVVPQLHVHHIARYRRDAVWPAPVWGAKPAVPYNERESKEIIDKLAAITAEK